MTTDTTPTTPAQAAAPCTVEALRADFDRYDTGWHLQPKPDLTHLPGVGWPADGHTRLVALADHHTTVTASTPERVDRWRLDVLHNAWWWASEGMSWQCTYLLAAFFMCGDTDLARAHIARGTYINGGPETYGNRHRWEPRLHRLGVVSLWAWAAGCTTDELDVMHPADPALNLPALSAHAALRGYDVPALHP